MSATKKTITWVVYEMSVHQKPAGANAVCEQSEWDAMEQARPGYHRLIQAGIANEGDAEKLARTGQECESKAPARRKNR